MADPIAVRTLIARFVTETCQAARKREIERQKENEDANRKEMENAVSSMVISATCPPLPPPPPPPPPPPRVPLPTDSSRRGPLPNSSSRTNGISGSKGPLKSTRQSDSSSPTWTVASKSEEECEQRHGQQKVDGNPFGDSNDDEEKCEGGAIVEVKGNILAGKKPKKKDGGGLKKKHSSTAGNPFGDGDSD